MQRRHILSDPVLTTTVVKEERTRPALLPGPLRMLDALLVFLAAAGLVVASVGVLLVLADAMEPTDIAPYSWFSNQLIEADALTGGEQTAAIAGAAIAGVLGVLIAVGHLAAMARRRVRTTRVEHEEELISLPGRAGVQRIDVSKGFAEQRLRHAVAAMDQVRHARIEIHPPAGTDEDRRCVIHATLALPADEDISVQEVADEARALLRASAERELAMGVDQVDLYISIEATAA